MRAARRLVGGAAIALVALVAAAGPAGAHALATSSVPASGSELRTAPAEIVITFTERPDPALSAIQVLDASGTVRASGRVTPVPGLPDQLEIPVHGLGSGVYTVTWRTVSAVDGHLATGSFAFGVNVSPAGAALPTAAVTKSPGPAPGAVAMKWVYYLGLMGLVGTAFTSLVVLRAAPPTAHRRAAAVAWLVAAGGTVGITEAQRAADGLALTDPFSSSLGHALIVRGVPLLAAGAAVVWVWRRRSRVSMAAVGITGAAAMLADVDTSHAAAAGSWTWLRMGTQWAHFLAVGIWIGGLAALLLVLRRLEGPARSRVVRRFSAAALVAFVAVALTGALRAVDEVGGWSKLTSTGFGQVVLVKIGIIAALGLLGAVNRFRNVPEVSRSARGLRRVGTGEVALAGCALAAAALLQNLAPPSLAAATPANFAAPLAPLVVRGADFSTTVKVGLTVSPGTAGFNRFTLAVSDYDTGRPVDATVSLHFVDPDRPDLGPSDLALHRVGPGRYTGQGANLAVEGTWTVTALIQQAASGTEVQLSVTPQIPAVPVTVQHNPGLPDIYDAALANRVRLEVSLDPGGPGFNELHAQYFTASGAPLVTSAYTVTGSRLPSGSPSSLTTRQLDVGHYVSDITVSRGRYRYVLSATAPDGSVLIAPIVIPVT